MRLSLQTDYAIRTLMFLASRPGRHTIPDVAQFYQISEPHVAKVVNQLARLGFVRSIRGVGGGIEIGRPADRITIGEIIRSFEGTMHLIDCVGMENFCVIQPACKLRGVLKEAERRQMDYLDNVTLSEVLPSPQVVEPVAVRRFRTEPT